MQIHTFPASIAFAGHHFLKKPGDFLGSQAQTLLNAPQNRLFLVDIGAEASLPMQDVLKRALRPFRQEGLVNESTSKLLVLTQEDARACPNDNWRTYLSEKFGLPPKAFLRVR